MNMIAVLDKTPGNSGTHAAFLEALRKAGFTGEIGTGHDTRLVHATDNSIYQRHPEAVICPRHRQDLEILARLAGLDAWRGVVFAPRGGGTGTNGQSLTDGIVVDLSRHMNRILEINVEEKWVRVEPGVVKDQLNAAIAAHGLFFAPELSTSNRATIGGMISTDASGQGSCTYGKTRDHVLGLSTILVGGETLYSTKCDDVELEALRRGESHVARIYDCVARISERERETIERVFPRLNRCLTGYDLRHLRDSEGRFDLTSLLCGSEGTLGFLAEAKLNLLSIPPYSILVNIRYGSFMEALRDARALIGLKPLSIETIDSKVLGLAMQDFVWNSVESYFPEDAEGPAKGLNLVEFAGHDERALRETVGAFLEHLRLDGTVRRRGHTLAEGRKSVSQVYAMRKRAVGLLGNVQGEARPQPFVEDTAVPPEKLADFIAEFRALLDGYGLDYGMFGHVDAGVLHVRPLLDMRNPRDAALIRPLSDEVHRLTRRYGGLLWGEHGKGVRSEYVPDVFGPLYPCLEEIKGVFDPFNQLNPGKIAAPAQDRIPLLRVDEVPLRGAQDRQIQDPVWKGFGAAMHCNGNGACFNYDQDDPMCPSWKATRDRRFSPKGRASLMREWLRLQAGAGVDTASLENAPLSPSARIRAVFHRRSRAPLDFSHQLYDSLASCLACKSCTSQCPVKVDVPDFRSRFLSLYHQRYARPLRDYLVGMIEYALPVMARLAPLYNLGAGLPPVRALLRRVLGLEDMPRLSRDSLNAVCREWGVEPATPERILAQTQAERERSVILMPDLFTRHFETGLVAAFIELAARCGYRVYLAESLACGKPLHVHGFLGLFASQARRNISRLRVLASVGVPLVGLDPAMTLIYRQEYRKLPGLSGVPDILLPQEFLLSALRPQEIAVPGPDHVFLGHCTEKTALTGSGADWQELFARLGMTLVLEKTGCCGMSGTFGHESRNLETSRIIFEQSWGPHLDMLCGKRILASGYSCRSQVRRFRGETLDHPLVALLDRLRMTAPPVT
ncbi:D-2-hydroxyglutarate dehydrogenase YdiJ [Asaia krungthepensis]|uniref:FAD/FMN-containing dehydrogenase n=1 Tax=Asaia krungthepensis NRIC 0535 TaxID=1307925 RepID=A0ABQ0PWS0_9PROT|nr:FAD-binding and (Fe-S)-binding domain-containing protein [Asaia krungthepensis]GBQ83501.1 FAD/FMN-containing dehydrogenase [Asaia krungthepensis NRIC 0535]